MPVLSETRHRGAFIRHTAVSKEMFRHGAAEGGVVRKEAGAVDSPHELLFVCKLNVGKGGVFCVKREIRPVGGGVGQEGSAENTAMALPVRPLGDMVRQ
jgi:hypothetical protein